MSAPTEMEGRISADDAYVDTKFAMRAIKVSPGKYFVTNEKDMMIVTVLGSCVSVCLRDRINGIGGMNHFMLAESTSTETGFSASARYGAFAMEVLINGLLKMGASRHNFEAKVFGAGRVLNGVGDIGRRNAEFALHYLQRENIRIAAQDLGDIYPRKVYFFPASGRVLVKSLRSRFNEELIVERAYGRELAKHRVGGDVDLFE